MRWQIVHDDDVALAQCRDQAFLQISQKDIPVHRAVDHKRRGDLALAQTGDEGCRFPMPMRRFAKKPFAAFAASAGANHVGRGAGLVEKDKLAWIKPVLRVFPIGPRLGDVGPILLAGVQSLF